MATMNSKGSSNAEVKLLELASSLSKYEVIPEMTDRDGNSGNSGNSGGLASPMIIYQAGSILYEMSRRVEEANMKQNNLSRPSFVKGYDELRNRFVALLLTVQDDHLSDVILGDISAAFISISQSFRNRAPGKQDNHSHSHSVDDDDDDSYSLDVLTALRSMSGIFVHSGSERVCKVGFDVRLCVEMALLYHHYFNLESHSRVQKKDIGADADADNIPGCILPILSSLLIYGLILPLNNNINNIKQQNHATIQDNDDEIRKIMEVFQTISSASPTDHHIDPHAHSTMVGCCLGDLWVYQLSTNTHPSNNINTLQQAIDYKFQHHNDQCDDTQKDYLMQIIQSCPKSHRTGTLKSTTTTNTTPSPSSTAPGTTTSNTNKLSALEKLVHTVRSIFPHLGEGYIEVALACYEDDAEKTITALVDADSNPNSLHPRLRVLDKTLPARKKESKSRYETLGNKGKNKNDENKSKKNGRQNGDKKDDDEEQEAYEIQKRHLKEMGDREETEALNLSIAMRVGGGEDEYDDDYDDQYDGIGNDGGGGRGGVGGADGGGGAYDVDLNAIKAYNKVAREMEKDRSFWEDSKNTNRKGGKKVVEGRSAKKDAQQTPQLEDEAEDEGGNNKTYRGPDKGKKGRAIGPDGKYLPIARGRKKKGKENAQSSGVAGTDAKDSGNGGKKPANGDSKTPGQANTGLTKIQKRRKNDNKAKVANHHRKDRALKKTGM